MSDDPKKPTEADPEAEGESNAARFGAGHGDIEFMAPGKGTSKSLLTPQEEADNAAHDKALREARAAAAASDTDAD